MRVYIGELNFDFVSSNFDSEQKLCLLDGKQVRKVEKIRFIVNILHMLCYEYTVGYGYVKSKEMNIHSNAPLYKSLIRIILEALVVSSAA